MRTKTTNFLQITVLLTALLYIAAGMIFFISPFVFGKLLAVPTSDEWLRQISADGFLVMIYLVARGLAALLVLSGISLVMPIFDPLKYRLLIHLFCVIFPLVSGVSTQPAGRLAGSYDIAPVMHGVNRATSS